MIYPRFSYIGNRAFFSNDYKSIIKYKYIAISVILVLGSLMVFPSVTAAENVTESNHMNLSSITSEQVNVTYIQNRTVYFDNTSPSNRTVNELFENGSDNPLILSDTIAENQTLAYTLVNQGLECYYSGNFECALRSFEAAHNILPDDINILYVQAQALFLQKRYADALDKIDAGLTIDPDSAGLWYQKGIILKELGNDFESGICFERAHELDPDFEIPFKDRFPANVFFKYGALFVLVIGFFLLGFFFYFTEIRK
jgi:tetratricopeptide (TPR) repeat protein